MTNYSFLNTSDKPMFLKKNYNVFEIINLKNYNGNLKLFPEQNIKLET